MGSRIAGCRIEPLRLLLIALLIFLVFVIIRTAWVCDDAYISFRTVDNFVHGHGLTWNIDERVQAFTNPLWVLVMSVLYVATGDVYYTSIVLSLVLTIGAVWILTFRVARTVEFGLLAMLVLMFSKAFVDFSTSGLENALTHFLLVVFFLLYFRDGRRSPKQFMWLCFVAALGMTNRLDTSLFYAPPLILSAFELPRKTALGRALIGFWPLLAWEAFSLIYYGFLLPNTYYAKLRAGIPHSEMLAQGLQYFMDSINADPLTLLAIVISFVAVLWIGVGRDRVALLGVAAYLLYTLWIGGDFMSGRYFAAPLLCCLVLLVRQPLPLARSALWVPVAMVVALGLITRVPTVASEVGYAAAQGAAIGADGIVDERGWYYRKTGLLQDARYKELPEHVWKNHGLADRDNLNAIRVTGEIGQRGFFAGPFTHLIDFHGLGDPLLSRLPTSHPHDWRIGHIIRRLPDGYEESVGDDTDVIQDPGLNAYYAKIRTIVRGNIWRADRWATIVQFNLGGYDYLKRPYCTDTLLRLDYSAVSRPKARGTVWNDTSNVVLYPSGLWIDLPERSYTDRIELSVDHNDDYWIRFYSRDKLLACDTIASRLIDESGLRVDTLGVKAAAFCFGYDRIFVQPWKGDGLYSLGHLRLLEPTHRGVARRNVWLRSPAGRRAMKDD